MSYIFRKIHQQVQTALDRGKSILLLGARQTGKTTYIKNEIKPDFIYSFADPEIRLRYEKNPQLLAQELKLQLSKQTKLPLVFIDEIQKIPLVMDLVQFLIDEKQAQFIVSGSSAHKLKYGTQVNLLPGRVVSLIMDPLRYDELPTTDLNTILTYGTLPIIVNENDIGNKEIDLKSYVKTYLEEEIRAEALVRNVGNFSRFLELAALESGNLVNFTKLSQDIGIATSTIIDYYQILLDCMIAHRIEPITETKSRRRLLKSPKYLFFDLGIRRACANEGSQLSENHRGKIFEQYVGIGLLHQTRTLPQAQLKYWRDTSGIEVDYVLDIAHRYIPIEVKWSEQPTLKDAKHLQKFLNEYATTKQGYIICRTPQPYFITENITALPWQQLHTVCSE